MWAASFPKPVEEPSKVAATRLLNALPRDGIRVVSLFEVLVFTYKWHQRAAGGGALVGPAGEVILGGTGWAMHAPGGGEGAASLPTGMRRISCCRCSSG